MKLARVGPDGLEAPALVDAQGVLRDLRDEIDDIGGDALDPEVLSRLRGLDASRLPALENQPRFGPCVTGVGKIVCIGLNYSDHAAESGMEVPPEPVIFMKATSAICGPDDDVILPRGSKKSDWEVELGVVIGRDASYVDEADAMAHVAGYCIVNDLSEREFQLERSGQWDKGKCCDTFAPIGPWLVTTDEIADPHDLAMRLRVNGHAYQDGSTRTMVYKVPYLVSYVSQFMTLKAGDIISTGTPPGVGMGQKPPVYLKAGDVMDVEIEGLGHQRQTVAAPRA